MQVTTKMSVTPDVVQEVLSRHLLTDGYHMVLDMERSHGVHLFDAASGSAFIDFFGFFASNALGMNHPKLTSDAGFMKRLTEAALNKVTNSDVYTVHLARFVDTFGRLGIPDYLPHAFFVSGGALAVENALKAAFDWKVRKNFQKGYRRERGHQVLHFEQAFHGRSGYTLSLTNTADPRKTMYYPRFDWPRVINPKMTFPITDESLEDVERRERQAIDQAKIHFNELRDDIACIIIEPIQGEGGDNHFRPRLLQQLRDLADENDALLVFDEIQTGVGITGSFWAHQALEVEPDIIAFGKKTQVCGILVGRRIEEVDDHVFELSSRINSTWGGNLVDMVRFDRTLEIMEEDNLVGNAAAVGEHLQTRLREIEDSLPFVTAARGRGLMCAFDLPTTAMRDAIRKRCFDTGILILGCGPRSLRFRPPLTITKEEIDSGLDVLVDAMRHVGGQGAA